MRYQLLSSMPTLPFTRQKRHLSPVPRILVLAGTVIPVAVIGFVLYKLAIITNAFRTYEANPPTFDPPFMCKGEDVEPRVDAFPHWTTADTKDVDMTVWNVKMELANRYKAAGLEVSALGPYLCRLFDAGARTLTSLVARPIPRSGVHRGMPSHHLPSRRPSYAPPGSLLAPLPIRGAVAVHR